MFSARCKRLLVVFSALLAFGYAVQLFWVHNRMELVCITEGVVSVYSPGYRRLLAAAAAGNAPKHRAAQFRLIHDFSFGSAGLCVPHDHNRFLDFLEETAAEGWAESQHTVAHYVMGRNHKPAWMPSEVPDSRQDIPLSFHYLQEAAEKGSQMAQYDLSVVYATGKWGDSYRADHTGQNRPEQVLLHSYTDEFLHAERGPNAMAVAIDYAKSMAWLEKAAAEMDDAGVDWGFFQSYRHADIESAVIDLAQRYRYGRYGAPQDSERAFALFSRLVNGKRYPEPRAAAELALMYAKGAGVAQDMEKARQLMDAAAGEANAEFKEHVEQLRVFLSQSE